MIIVTRKDSNESIENLLRRFSRKVSQSGALAAAKQTQFFDKPMSKSDRRRSAITRDKKMQDQIENDLKQAMLAGDKTKAETLKTLKNALQYEAINLGSKDKLTDEQVQKVLAREAKKRQETADIYKNAGVTERAEVELAEKVIIEQYLPQQASEADIQAAVKEAIAATGASSVADMGKIIAVVRAKLGASADGATIANIAKDKLQ